MLQEVHKEVPYQVERRVCPGDSDWDDVRDSGVGGSFSPSTIADAFNQATRNDNDNNVGSGREVIPGVRSEDIDEAVSVRSTGGTNSNGEVEEEEEADPNKDAIVFG